MKYDVFISYSRKDTVIADRICSAFDKAGISYFIDRQGIGGGFEFPTILAENILDSRIFLFLGSKNSYDSKFTNNEILFAFNKKPHNSLLPYLIDDTPLPLNHQFTFASINVRNSKEHPIETVLVNDVLLLLGRTRQKAEDNPLPKQEQEEIIDSSNEIDEQIATETIPNPIEKRVAENTKTDEVVTPEIDQLHKKEDVVPTSIKKDLVLRPDSRNDKWGFIDKEGKTIIPFEYDDADYFFEGLARVKKNGKYGFIDKQGKIIIPFEYDDVGSFFKGLANVKKNGKWGYIDKQDKTIIPFEYDEVRPFHQKIVSVKKNEKWGFIDVEGNTIVPFEFEEAKGFHCDRARLKKNEKWGFIDIEGNIVVPFEFEEANDFSYDRARLKKNGNWGFIDVDGNIVVPFKYLNAHAFRRRDGIITAEVGKYNLFGRYQSFRINIYGKRID